jgi:hypothetical protein
MANALFDSGVNAAFQALLNFATGKNQAGTHVMKIMGLNSSYTPNLSAHANLSDIVSGDRVTLGVDISTLSPSFAARLFKFGAALFPAVTSGVTITYVVLYLDTGTEATSTLIGLTDTATDLPATGTGADISFTPDATLGLFSF